MLGKVTDHMGKVGLAEGETENSNLAIKYYRGCDGGRNSQSHKRVCWKVNLEQRKLAALFPL